MTIKEQILGLLDEYKELSVKEIVSKTQSSKQMVHLALNALLSVGLVQKLGRTPKTSYRIVDKESPTTEVTVPQLKESDSQLLNELFFAVDELGNLLIGADALAYWCTQHQMPFEQSLKEFDKTLQNNRALYDEHGNINATEHLLNTKGFDTVWIDNLYYLDVHRIDKFGLTPLATLVHYGKQGQSTWLMKLLLAEVKNRIQSFIKLQKADAVAFVAPTLKRELQLMKFLQSNLDINLPLVEIKKVNGPITVPQTELSLIQQRVKNAENTFTITDHRKFKHLILIDDVVSSGATLNQIAGKIKLKGIAAEVTAIGIVGNIEVSNHEKNDNQ